MANNNAPFGLLWLGTTLSGGHASIQHFTKLVGYATGIFTGDPVNRVAGYIQASATPGTTLYSGVSLDYSPAATAGQVTVLISPDAIYACQDSDGNTTGIVIANLGDNANLLAGAGSTLTRQSGYTIDDTTVATTNTLDLHLLNLYATVSNAFGPYAIVEVVFNKHRMAPGVAGA